MKTSTLTSLELVSLFVQTTDRPFDRVRKKMKNYAEIFSNIVWKKVTIMW